MKSEDKFLSSLENDILGFLYMCDKSDIEFINKPDSARSNEDYLRLCIISLTFGLKGAFLRIVKEAEDNDRIDEMFESLDKYKKEYQLVKKWIEDFISRIKDEMLKDMAKNMWIEKTKIFEKEGFSYANLFGFA